MKRPSFRSPAFSLTEVTVALGLAAFCLIAVFGLLPVGITSNQASIEQTTANGILSAVIADLRATLPGQAGKSAQFSITIPQNPVQSLSSTTFYLGSDGRSAASMGAETRYRLMVSFLPNGFAKAATLVNLKVSWPAPVDPARHTPTGFVQCFVALDRN